MPDTNAAPFTLPDEPPPATVPSVLVLEADEVLDPAELVPASAILARLEGLPGVIHAASHAKTLVVASQGVVVTTPEQRVAADELRDKCKAHEKAISVFFDPVCDAANKLHKGCTGLRSFALGDVAAAAKRLGDAIAASIRAEQVAEQARQQRLRDLALETEKKKKQDEADAADLERLRLQMLAAETVDETDKAMLEDLAKEQQQAADVARLEVQTAVAPPIAARPVETPAGGGAKANWQARPEHAEEQEEMPLKDKVALIVAVAKRLAANDGSLVHLLSVDWKAAKAKAVAEKETFNVPGLRAVNLSVYSKRAAKG